VKLTCSTVNTWYCCWQTWQFNVHCSSSKVFQSPISMLFLYFWRQQHLVKSWRLMKVQTRRPLLQWAYWIPLKHYWMWWRTSQRSCHGYSPQCCRS